MGRSRDAECPAVLRRVPYNKQLSGSKVPESALSEDLEKDPQAQD